MRALAGLWVAAMLVVPHVASGGGDNGSGNDQRRECRTNCRGSFSPGPFDRSPVDVHDNCVSLDCSGGGRSPSTTTTR